MVLHELHGEDDLAKINNMNIDLIPKVRNLKSWDNFWPIKLCNVIYKIASKTMANRLWNILPEVISEEFNGRLIIDNIITTYECVHFMKKKRARDNRF